ncbi:hypothetical protein E4U53_004035, partial [Claviceps sorghi]
TVSNPTGTDPSSVALSKTDSLVNLDKKPILKKRSMSEVMLQRSLISASLLKQATAAVQAQENRGVLKHNREKQNITDYYVTYPLSLRRESQGTTHTSSLAASTDSSNLSSPFPERKHIHFNEKVEQCIAINMKDDDEDDVFGQDHFDQDSDSDVGGLMMKHIKSKKRTASLSKRRSKKPAASEGKIIAKLPSTTLKYRKDTPEPQETAMKHSTGMNRGSMISPSSSQETLRPSKNTSRFFFGEAEYEEDDFDDETLCSNAGWRSPPGTHLGSGGIHRSPSGGSLMDEPAGMRRTPSGMFMPCEEGEAAAGDGIFGRVIDTVNTARDIAHVIWNVGWRK